eukprot:SAG31_NODE_34639_length_331_cov_0.655172_1_plen_48_part_01
MAQEPHKNAGAKECQNGVQPARAARKATFEANHCALPALSGQCDKVAS